MSRPGFSGFFASDGSTQAGPSSPSPSSESHEFSQIIAQPTWLLDEGNEDNEPVVISEDWTSIPISQLFDFTNNS